MAMAAARRSPLNLRVPVARPAVAAAAAASVPSPGSCLTPRRWRRGRSSTRARSPTASSPSSRTSRRLSPPSWIFAWLDSGRRLYLLYAAVYLAPYLRCTIDLVVCAGEKAPSNNPNKYGGLCQGSLDASCSAHPVATSSSTVATRALSGCRGPTRCT